MSLYAVAFTRSCAGVKLITVLLFKSRTLPDTAALLPSSGMRSTEDVSTVPGDRLSSKVMLIVGLAWTLSGPPGTFVPVTTGGTISATYRVRVFVAEVFGAASFAEQDSVMDAFGSAVGEALNVNSCVADVDGGFTVKVLLPEAAPVAVHVTDATPMLSVAMTVAEPVSPGLYRAVWPRLVSDVTTGAVSSRTVSFISDWSLTLPTESLATATSASVPPGTAFWGTVREKLFMQFLAEQVCFCVDVMTPDAVSEYSARARSSVACTVTENCWPVLT